MGTPDIPMDKAELLSVLLEAILYGFSLLMFGGTIWTLMSQRSTDRVKHQLIGVACALLLSSTAHLVIDIIRIMDAFILYRDNYPEGPVGYFSDASQWTFVFKNIVFVAQTLIANGIILYRCYVVWKSKVVIIVPTLLWCAVVLTGIGSLNTRAGQSMVFGFGWSISQWIASFYALMFVTNLVSTLLLAYRILYIERKTTSLHRQSRMGPILHIIIDAGMIYSLTILVVLICFIDRSNGQYVILDMITSIISITFYMVIIRAEFVDWANQWSLTIAPAGNGFGNGRGSRMMPSRPDRLSSMVPVDHGWQEQQQQQYET